MKKILLLLFIALMPLLAIVDIAPQEVGERPGFSGNIAGSYTGKSGNTQKNEYDFSGKIEYDNESNFLTFLQGSYELTESKGVKIEDQKFFHFRFLHKLNNESLYGEIFSQYKQDIFKDIDNRWLNGANIRWRFVDSSELGKLYLGAGILLENIQYVNSPNDPAGTAVQPDENSLRVNSYMAYKHNLNPSTKLSMIGYYQPSLEQGSDYYASFTAELELRIIKEIYLSLIYRHEYDSKPAISVEKRDTMTKTSIVWKF
ncbi:DUF481 domain-containing protein [Sulfurimonas sp.]|uniref:DUF481 domain-containing protein n=1 Tax=Sulfurimonas sp. TaxID=2022749 RepID=UPI0025DB9626|nr:DUF481 domain-containing protein [Sulfurimonas sp.]MDD5157381.1 DUF481 domain-containing protein [Sulfurimonas sp.]